MAYKDKSKQTTHIRVEKGIFERTKIELPEYKPSEIFKVGFQFLKGMNKGGEFIYGKDAWKRFKKK